MGITINGTSYTTPYINGVKYNGYVNGQKIWSTLPYPVVWADSSGNVQCKNLCGYGYFCDVEYKIYNASGTILGSGAMYDYDTDYPCTISIGVGNCAYVTYCLCSFG